MTLAATALADRLQLILDGRDSLDDLLDDPAAFEGELANCIHGLHHFLMDEDIRAKEAGYRLMQESEMQELIAHLRAGAPGSDLRKISFLGRSRA